MITERNEEHHVREWYSPGDSNPRPTGYKPGALTNCARGAYLKKKTASGTYRTRTYDKPVMSRGL